LKPEDASSDGSWQLCGSCCTGACCCNAIIKQPPQQVTCHFQLRVAWVECCAQTSAAGQPVSAVQQRPVCCTCRTALRCCTGRLQAGLHREMRREMRGDAFLAQAAAAASAPAAREDLYCISRALEAREGTAPTHLPCGQPLPCRRPQLDTAIVVDTALRRKVLLPVVLRPVPPVPVACASRVWTGRLNRTRTWWQQLTVRSALDPMQAADCRWRVAGSTTVTMQGRPQHLSHSEGRVRPRKRYDFPAP